MRSHTLEEREVRLNSSLLQKSKDLHEAERRFYSLKEKEISVQDDMVEQQRKLQESSKF